MYYLIKYALIIIYKITFLTIIISLFLIANAVSIIFFIKLSKEKLRLVSLKSTIDKHTIKIIGQDERYTDYLYYVNLHDFFIQNRQKMKGEDGKIITHSGKSDYLYYEQ